MLGSEQNLKTRNVSTTAYLKCHLGLVLQNTNHSNLLVNWLVFLEHKLRKNRSKRLKILPQWTPERKVNGYWVDVYINYPLALFSFWCSTLGLISFLFSDHLSGLEWGGLAEVVAWGLFFFFAQSSIFLMASFVLTIFPGCLRKTSAKCRSESDNGSNKSVPSGKMQEILFWTKSNSTESIPCSFHKPD